LDQVLVGIALQADGKDEAYALAGIAGWSEDKAIDKRLVRGQERKILLAYGEIEVMGTQVIAPLRKAKPPFL